MTAAEIRYAVEVEGCRTLEDLRRHTHVGAGPCDGADCVAPAAHTIAELLDWPPDRTAPRSRRSSTARWAGRRPVLSGATLAAEEVLRGL